MDLVPDPIGIDHLPAVMGDPDLATRTAPFSGFTSTSTIRGPGGAETGLLWK